MPTEVEKANQEAAGVLKKVRASRGKLQGNFYFVGKADGSEGGLKLTLAGKDVDGGKAKTGGKKLRAEIKGAKFALGLVQVIDGKLTFVLHGGSASKSHISKCFKKTLSKVDGLRLLLKVLIKKAGDLEGEAIDEKELNTPEEEEVLSPEEQAELASLEREQAALGDLSVHISAFLSHNNELEEYNDQLHIELTNLQELRDAGASAEEIHAARVALSEVMDVGQSLHITEGTPLPEGIRDVLNLSAQNMYL